MPSVGWSVAHRDEPANNGKPVHAVDCGRFDEDRSATLSPRRRADTMGHRESGHRFTGADKPSDSARDRTGRAERPNERLDTDRAPGHHPPDDALSDIVPGGRGQGSARFCDGLG
jgi:hypothetical protein